MTPKIPFAGPTLGDPEVEALRRVIESGWVTQGPEVARFEEEFAQFVGAPHAVAVSNCTAALHLALLALGVGPGDEVIVPTHTFVASANAIVHAGATPVFADIERDTYNLDPDDVARRIGPRTRAIMAVHQLGLPCDLGRLLELARERSLLLVEDAACAIGSEVNLGEGWERIGRPRGDAACFSFHPRKILTTGDGGMITFRDAALAEACRRMRHHGTNLPDTARHGATEVLFPTFTAPGFNYRLTDLQAAVGRVQLGRLPELLARRRALSARYRGALADVPQIALPLEPEWARGNVQTFCLRLTDACAKSQQQVMQALLERGIATRRGAQCCHLEPAHGAAPREGLERSVEARDRGIMLPMFAGLTEAQADQVAEALREIVR